ncbi:hypothetical protein SA2149_06340 [Aggregatibacter actinomycetemcomitans serotype e str. SA2149]|nr:hypothetical protein SA2149_06340 [Aggregatibacter actinomycetemcomitans serotype e str. SA2149]KYK80964.1 hypothetical protein SC383S_02930 [Aggregatibacter actinomycetemcomitans SC383s]
MKQKTHLLIFSEEGLRFVLNSAGLMSPTG